MAEPITMQKLTDASFDADTLGEFANEDKLVTSRLGAKYPSAQMASRLVAENGLLGATPFSTYAAMAVGGLEDGAYAVVTNDADDSKNGIYKKDSGLYVYQTYNWQNFIKSLQYAVFFGGSVKVNNDAGIIVFPNIKYRTQSGVVSTIYSGVELPLSSDSSQIFYYIDIGKNATGVRLKYSKDSLPVMSDVINIGYSSLGVFTQEIATPIAYTNQPIAAIDVISKQPIIIDSGLSTSGTRAAYLPKNIYIKTRNNSSNIVVTNPESLDVPDYIKVDVSAALSGKVVNISLDITKKEYVVTAYPSQVNIDSANFVSILTLWGAAYNSQTNIPIVNTVEGSTFGDTCAAKDAIARSAITDLQKPTAKYNTKVIYGQSLAAGQESWPALSKDNNFGNLMLGDNVRPAAYEGSTYPTFGAATLKPLLASVVSASGSKILSESEVKALPAGNAAFGEPINHGFVNAAKHYLNQKLLTTNDESRLFVTINPAVSGRTIEQLSKNNTQDAINRYGRFIDGLTKVDTATGADTHVVDSVVWVQGEYNYKNDGGSWDRLAYKTLFNSLINDMQADCQSITGQSLPPAFFTYQTTAKYTRDVDSAGNAGLHVGMAQLEVSNKRNDTFMFGPSYPYTDKGGHLDSNGYRWMGNKAAQVYKHVVLDGKNWSPLQPIKITQSGKKIRIDFYVPVPPLQLKSTYVANTATMYASKGFRVSDNLGDAQIVHIDVSETHIEILTDRIVSADAHVWYASLVTDGGGNLCDSDNFKAFNKYIYVPDSGMYASANIPELVNKPYPLENWCVAFYLPIDYVYTAS